MTRVKRGTQSVKTRKYTLKKVKGYRHGRKSKERQANEAISHAGSYAFAHRRDFKNDMRRLWQVRISAESKKLGISYSKFIGALKKKNVELDRKILADLAENHSQAFEAIVALVHPVK
ncbi:MAG: 50S ribosomal protein L20 [Patescibacteria group bacterium]